MTTIYPNSGVVFKIREILNTVLDGADLTGINSYSPEEVLNMVFDEANAALKIKLDGGVPIVDGIEVTPEDSPTNPGAGNILVYWDTDNVMHAIDENGDNIYDQTTINMMSKGTVYRFDGVDDVITVTAPAEAANIFSGGGFFEFEIYPLSDGENSSARILDKDANSDGWICGIRGESGGNVQIYFLRRFDGTSGEWWSPVTIPIGAAVKGVIVYDEDSVANDPVIYINGVSVAVTEQSTPVGTAIDDTAENLLIGNNTAGARTFDGEIGEVMIGNFAPTAAEVKDLVSGN
ncbi:MAG: LamG domain-containing protein, partial [Candidatus Brocadiales bacterium]|nr:LamG domain-containing protein [Candidatus Brocadiales bacterium]